MVQNRKPTGRASSMPAGLAFGAGVGMLITLIGTALIAKMVDLEYMDESKIGYGVMVMLMMSSFADAMTSAGKIKRQRLMVCAFSGAIYFLILLSITALFFGGQYEAVGVTAILVAGGAMLAALTSVRRGRGAGKRKVRLPNR